MPNVIEIEVVELDEIIGDLNRKGYLEIEEGKK